MSSLRAFAVCALFLTAQPVFGEGDPLAKVTQLLSDLQAKVIKDGEAAQKEYAEYAEWCEDKYKDLSYEITTGKAQVAMLKATIVKESSTISALGTKIEEIVAGVASEEADLKSATALRAEEDAAFSAEEKELMEIVDTLERAIRMLNKELKKGSAALMQLARMPNLLKAFDAMVQASVITTADASKLTAFLQGSQQDSDDDSQTPGAPEAAVYESHSAGIIDTLEGLLEKATEQLDSLRKTETNAQHNFEMMKQSLEDEIKFATKDLAASKASMAASEEAKSVAEGDLEVTTKDLAEDIKELADTKHACETTAGDFEAAAKSRDEELKAIADAKSVLAETTGGAVAATYGLNQVAPAAASFLQYAARTDISNFAVVRFVRSLARKQGSTALAQLANRIASTIRFNARQGSDPFAKVKGLISEMIESLESSAQTDASHKAYCDKETAETTDKKEDKTAEISKLSTSIDKMSSRIAVLQEEVAQLNKELASIASSKAAYDTWFMATEETFTSMKADMEKGIDGVKMALKVLGEYYAGGDAAHGAAVGAANGIIGLLEVVEGDFSKGLAEIEAGFANVKREYEAFAKEAELATAMKNQDVKYKSQEMTKLQKALGEATADKTGVQAELDAILEYMTKINEMCIAKAEPYSERKERREAEIAGLKEALQVLEGEAVLLQQGRSTTQKSLRGVSRHFGA
jgi:chromosome segregation ATPase